MVALAATLVLLAFPAVVFGGRTFNTGWQAVGVNGFAGPSAGVKLPTDGIHLDAGASAWQFEPWAEVTHRALQKGQPPLWNPYQGLGAPLAANFQSAVFDPLLALVNLHPTPLTWDFSFLVALVMGAVSMYLFLRHCALRRLPALVGTVPFILSGYFFLFSNNQFFRAYLYLPLLFLLVRLTLTTRSVAAPIGLGLAVAGNLLIGMPEASILVLGAVGSYSVFALAVIPQTGKRFHCFLRLSGAATLGLLLAAPLLLPALEYVARAHSTHEGSNKVGLFTAGSNQLLNWLVPYALGKPASDFRGVFSGTTNWVGTASAVALIAALASPSAMRRHGGWFFLGLGGFLLGKIYGFPLLQWVGRLPGLDRVNIPIFALPVVAFACAVLVAVGVQATIDSEPGRRQVIILLGMLCVGFLWLLRANDPYLGHSPSEHLVRWFGLAALATLVAAAGVLVRGRIGTAALALVILGELVLLAPRDFQARRLDPYTQPAWLREVSGQLVQTHERIFGLDAKLFPNIAGAYGLSDLRAVDALYPERYAAYIKHFIQPDFHDRFVGGAYASAERSPGHIADNPMFDLTGVRYVITGGSTPAGTMINDYFRQTPPSSSVFPSAFDSGGDFRTVLALRPGARASLSIPQGATNLSFSVASDPSSPEGQVRAVVAPAGAITGLWETSTTHEWRDATIDLPSGVTAVDLIADSTNRPGAPSLGFADIRFGVGTVPSNRQFREVTSSDGARVFENSRRLPRAFVVHDLVVVRSETQALATLSAASLTQPGGSLKLETLDPRRTAVVENLPAGSNQLDPSCQPDSRTSIRSYEPGRVVIDVDSSCPGLLVFTDMFDPGWAAKVDGRKADIHPTDVAFRGVMIGSGKSTVEFRYRPRSFTLGVASALAGAMAAAAALLLSAFVKCRRSGD